jgi:hypothetical protein
MEQSEKTLDMIVNLCKNRGYVFPGSEIYGGLANSWDYGPLGVEFKNNVKKAWLKKFVQESPYNVGLDAAIIMNPQTWVFSARGAHAEDLPVTTKDFDLIRAIVTDRYKLIYNPVRELPYWPVDFSHEPFWLDLVEQNRTGFIPREWKERYFSERPMFELYDLKNDPQELHNLAGLKEYAEIEKKLRDTMAEKMLVDRDYVPLPFYSLDKEYK